MVEGRTITAHGTVDVSVEIKNHRKCQFGGCYYIKLYAMGALNNGKLKIETERLRIEV